MKVAGGKLRGMLAAGAAVGAMAAGIGVLGMGGADAATSGTTATTALSRSQLLTVGEVKKADARRNWFRQVDKGILPRTYCGRRRPRASMLPPGWRVGSPTRWTRTARST